MELFTILVLLAIFSETSFLILHDLGPVQQVRGRKRKIYVDTSVLIDGRILAVAETGFLDGHLIIPRSVLHELQLLADGKDSERRARARYGMDVAKALEESESASVTILQDELDRTLVDNRLLELAQANNGWIITNDYNLNKLANAEGIPVLNLNDLAMVLRGEYLPGEHTVAKITAKGSNARQGIGYLPDGTMLVVDNASNKVGKEIEVEFTRLIQTSAGKMIFAKIVEPGKSPRDTRRISGRAAVPKSDDNPAKNITYPKTSAEAENELIRLLAESENDLATFDKATQLQSNAITEKKSPKSPKSASKKLTSRLKKTGTALISSKTRRAKSAASSKKA